jgi:hypothetical protein
VRARTKCPGFPAISTAAIHFVSALLDGNEWWQRDTILKRRYVAMRSIGRIDGFAWGSTSAAERRTEGSHKPSTGKVSYRQIPTTDGAVSAGSSLYLPPLY